MSDLSEFIETVKKDVHRALDLRDDQDSTHGEMDAAEEVVALTHAPLLLGMIEAVAALHKLDGPEYDPDTAPDSDYRCTDCGQGWPCETTQAMERARSMS